jgi:hypothetical protein
MALNESPPSSPSPDHVANYFNYDCSRDFWQMGQPSPVVHAGEGSRVGSNLGRQGRGVLQGAVAAALVAYAILCMPEDEQLPAYAQACLGRIIIRSVCLCLLPKSVLVGLVFMAS